MARDSLVAPTFIVFVSVTYSLDGGSGASLLLSGMSRLILQSGKVSKMVNGAARKFNCAAHY
jgi:hypothetical protein